MGARSKERINLLSYSVLIIQDAEPSITMSIRSKNVLDDYHSGDDSRADSNTSDDENIVSVTYN